MPPSLNSSDLPRKVRFKGCLYSCTCNDCNKNECKSAGNYDITGWRYDTVVGYGPLGSTERVMLESGLFLHLYQCDFYTLEPPESVVIPIL